MNAPAFAWRSLVRQPARAALGILGVAAVGALLLDMLLLSRGLVLSMRDVLDRAGLDLRISAHANVFGPGDRIADATRAAAAVSALEEVEEVVAVRLEMAQIDGPEPPPLPISLVGTSRSRRRPWTLLEGDDVGDAAQAGHIVISRPLAVASGRRPGDTLMLRVSCNVGASALPPVAMRVTGVVEFPFDTAGQMSAATTLDDLRRACGELDPSIPLSAEHDKADLLLAASAETSTPDNARAAIQRLRPGLFVLTNEQAVARLQQAGFSYFQQVSTVLATVTVCFAVLLVTVLLTVSVNQRLGVIAALRALGFSERRVIVDLLCESALIVGAGGALSLPLGLALANLLDGILRSMPGIPARLHFFVFEPRALATHLTLLGATAIVAALYPIRIVARLPIAATLRNEVVS